MYEKIEIDNSFYVLKALVRNHNVHFTCAIHNDKKWLYLDDLYKNVREFANIELMQQQFPGGWFFACLNCFVTMLMTIKQLQQLKQRKFQRIRELTISVF